MAALNIQFASDLHIDQWPHNIRPEPNVDIIVIAGDVCEIGSESGQALFTRWIADMASQFPQVIFVKGNHEAYGTTLDKADAFIIKTCLEHPNVTYLNRGSIDLPGGFRILGCTLWSNIEPEQEREVQSYINDFKHIKGDWDVEHHVITHEEDVQWLVDETHRAEQEQDVTLIVVTHFPPLNKGVSAPYIENRRGGDPVRSYFATDLSELCRHPKITAWIYGHTHYNNAQYIASEPAAQQEDAHACLVVSNQRGHPGERTAFRSQVLELRKGLKARVRIETKPRPRAPPPSPK